jgi:hypothetical protein
VLAQLIPWHAGAEVIHRDRVDPLRLDKSAQPSQILFPVEVRIHHIWRAAVWSGVIVNFGEAGVNVLITTEDLAFYPLSIANTLRRFRGLPRLPVRMWRVSSSGMT